MSGPITQAIQSVFRPISAAFGAAANGIGDFSAGILHASELAEDSRRLRSLESGALLYQEHARLYEAEIARLRKMLELPPTPGKTPVSAAVIGYYPLENRGTLSIGSKAGVRKGMAVVAPEGLVGIVQTVDAGSSQFLLISSPQLKLVGMVQRDPAPLGFIKGQSASSLVYEVLDADVVVQNGDSVVTSGFSDRIPAGIPIGRIVQVEEDEAFGSRRCQVFPNVQIGSVREVFVLK